MIPTPGRRVNLEGTMLWNSAANLWYDERMTPTDIDIADELIRIMRARPEVREAIRREVLTEDVLNLPKTLAETAAIVRGMSKTQAEHTEAIAETAVTVHGIAKTQTEHTAAIDDLAKTQAEHTAAIDGLNTKVDSLDTGVDSLDAKFASLDTKLGDLVGAQLEKKAASKLVPILSQTYGLERARVVHPLSAIPHPGHTFFDSVEDAAKSGKITDAQKTRLGNTDLVFRARKQSDGSHIWMTAETSTTIRISDIERAVESAIALKAMSAEESIPIVIGYHIRDEDRVRADANGVSVFIANQP